MLKRVQLLLLKLILSAVLIIAIGVMSQGDSVFTGGKGTYSPISQIQHLNAEEKQVVPVQTSKPKEPLVVIDPGHGGEETGTYYGDVIEKNLNLDISLKLGKILKQSGINIIFTREKDEFLSLRDRSKIANEAGADLFISVHNNNMPGNPNFRGTETLYCINAEAQINNMDGKKLASIVQGELVKALKTRNNGIIFRPNLSVLRHTKMPAVIAEIAYVSNESDRSKLVTLDFRQKSAEALANAVIKALRIMELVEHDDGNKVKVSG